jgi:hypothetical protein
VGSDSRCPRSGIDFGKVTGKNLTLGNWQGAIMPGNYSKRSTDGHARRDPQWGN